MFRHASLILALLAAARAALPGEEPAAPLKVTEPAGIERTAAPVTGGVPVEPLGVEDVKELLLLDAAGKPVPAQLTPLVRLEDGRLQWVLVDFLVDLGPRETKRFTLRRLERGDAAVPLKNPVKVEQTDETLTLTNGVLKAVLSKKKFDLFDMIWLDRDGDGKFSDAEKVLAPRQIKVQGDEKGDDDPHQLEPRKQPAEKKAEPNKIPERPAALSLLRGRDGKAFSSRKGRVEKVTVEYAGPVRATVRLDGSFGSEDGKESWLKYTVRATAWAGRPELGMLYTVRNVNPQAVTDEQIKKAAVTVKLAEPAGKKHYLLETDKVHMSQICKDKKETVKGSQWHFAVELAQVGPPVQVCGKSHRRFYKLIDFDDAGYRVRQHQPGKRKPVVDVGFRCGGWLDLAGDNGGCLVWMRDFTEDCPKRLVARATGELSVEVIPEYAGKNQPYYAAGGYWLGDRSWRSYELSFNFHGEPFLTGADWTRWDGVYFNYTPPTPQTAAKVAKIPRRARQRLQLVSTPEWFTRTGTLWGAMPTIAEENAAARAMGRTKAGPVQENHVAALAAEFLHYENFHYRSEWDEPRDALVEFIRTGQWATFTRAQAFARNYRDLGVWHSEGGAGGGRGKGPRAPKNAAAIPRWGKFCGCHHYGAGLIDMWLATGDRSYLEAGLDWGRQCAVTGGYGSFGYRHWGRRMIAALRAYQVTRDPKLKEFLVEHCRPPTPGEALRADGRALLAGKKMASWMVGLCTHAVWHNYVENRDSYKGVALDDFEDGIIGMARQVAKYWWNEETGSGPYHFLIDGAGPGKVKFTGGSPDYSLTCVDTMTRGYLLTGDRRLLLAARKYWDNANGADPTLQNARLQDMAGMGAGSFWARQLIYEYAHPRKDAVPPAAIADLAAEALGGGRVKLAWTAPRDEGGRVARYQIKHAPRSFCTYQAYRYPQDHGRKWTWWAGYNVAGEPQPAEAGEKQSVTLSGVPAGRRCFCIRSRDDSNNESALSNVVELEVK